MMCLRLSRGARSGYASVDAMGALVTTLFTLCNPGVARWLRVGVRVTMLCWALNFPFLCLTMMSASALVM